MSEKPKIVWIDENNREWTDEEIKELEDKAEQEKNSLNLLTQMSVQDSLTIFKMDGEIHFWKRLFLIGLTVFLIIEIIWIILYLLVNTNVFEDIWNFIGEVVENIPKPIPDMLRRLL